MGLADGRPDVSVDDAKRLWPVLSDIKPDVLDQLAIDAQYAVPELHRSRYPADLDRSGKGGSAALVFVVAGLKVWQGFVVCPIGIAQCAAAGDHVAAGKPAIEVDIGAAGRAEREERLARRPFADRTGPGRLELDNVVGGHQNAISNWVFRFGARIARNQDN